MFVIYVRNTETGERKRFEVSSRYEIGEFYYDFFEDGEFVVEDVYEVLAI